ncbi:bifunctional adenosylcobinamide kinase/adenosylcobinamide-phosphate guanylyltransferase [Clostridium ganghwense]|uniref:Adenosylcobinamide kinase n=1 Tax=Clostridium ganghwense TaxID=312089 RepID=A0ABT4CKR9_9CLOT|nr:bifunctional adenosylcobinamide kinase/adenosylcobinamide-phosphate guanylyltransferase [Clostridium ganghwense]MCY6369642.1 bifunctional adenosylcobinamide kinase/adenosylcobinamide-phosphate guanylyltransferase [Clostridium ganghwense]
MSKVILITGACRSGKSSYAEKLLKEEDDVLYIATAKALDKEMEDRIEKHKSRRNGKWSTYEGFKKLDKVVEKSDKKYILLDCVTILVTNLMFDRYEDFDSITMEEVDELSKNIKREVEKMILEIRKKDKNIIIVTNEVGWGLVPEYKVSRIFRDIAGWINQYIASMSDEVYLMACGLPLKLK